MASQGSNGKRVRPPSFKLEIPGNAEIKARLLQKMGEVRKKMTELTKKSVNNAEILEGLLDSWIKVNNTASTAPAQRPNTVRQTRQTVNSQLYVTTTTSLQKFASIVESHSRGCRSRLSISQVFRRGHAGLLKLKCARRGGKSTHSYWWATSETFPGGKYLVNERVLHGLMFSGMRPSHYRRFAAGSNIGIIDETKRKDFYNRHSPLVECEYQKSVEMALLQEMACYDMRADEEDQEEWQGIDVISDARHGHRRNAKDTSVVVLGERTKKVLGHFHITKALDPCTQRHEKIGVTQFYEYMKDMDVPVRIHTHDRNMSINAYVRSLDGPINQNDRWHGIKGLKKALNTICNGRVCDSGKTWHWQLQNKVEPIATHAHWAIEHCDGDPEKLQESLMNVVAHYTNDHTNCHANARCKTDEDYEPSKPLLESPRARELLTNCIKKSTLYSSAKDFVYGKYSFHVESFNNIMNMFHDKRIYYSDQEYNTRSQISVLYWNENSGRKVNSVWKANATNSRSRSAPLRNNYTDPTFHYRKRIWQEHCENLLN